MSNTIENIRDNNLDYIRNDLLNAFEKADTWELLEYAAYDLADHLKTVEEYCKQMQLEVNKDKDNASN